MKLNSFEGYDTPEFLQLTKECDKYFNCENCRWCNSCECELDWDTYTNYLSKVL